MNSFKKKSKTIVFYNSFLLHLVYDKDVKVFNLMYCFYSTFIPLNLVSMMQGYIRVVHYLFFIL